MLQECCRNAIIGMLQESYRMVECQNCGMVGWRNGRVLRGETNYSPQQEVETLEIMDLELLIFSGYISRESKQLNWLIGEKGVLVA